MMTTVQAYAARKAGGKLEPFEYKLKPIPRNQVDIEVETCGICHSDLSMVEGAWSIAQFPLVPGHEVIGKIVNIGEGVPHLQLGDRVGLGWHSSYCMSCDTCLSGDHNLCPQAEGTIVGRYGGFASHVRARSESVFTLPNNLDPKKMGPLFCGGITVFNPLVQHHLSPTAHVGVIGIGGLGHLAIQFAKAWGCEVTAFTSSEAKKDEALELGAHRSIFSRDHQAIRSMNNSIDLLLSTVNVPLDWDLYIETLKPKGRLHLLGAVLEPIPITLLSLLHKQGSVTASPVGSPATIRKMLNFSGRHGITPVTEHFPMNEVNLAIDHLRSGKARYRIVLER